MSQEQERIRDGLQLWARGESAWGIRWIEARRDRVEQAGSEPVRESKAELRIAEIPANTELPAPATTRRAVEFSAPLPALNLSREERIARLRELDETQVRQCRQCGLHQGRTTTVFGEGDPEAKLFFIGEGPGYFEDQKGRPFVGRAGELLGKMIASMGLQREEVYIANIVKCRATDGSTPPRDRAPVMEEVSACGPYLVKQLEIVSPRVIVTLGRPATCYMLQTTAPITQLRGVWAQWRGVKLMPTFHPSYVLRQYTAETRAAVWSDLQQVMVELGLPIPQRG